MPSAPRAVPSNITVAPPSGTVPRGLITSVGIAAAGPVFPFAEEVSNEEVAAYCSAGSNRQLSRSQHGTE